MRDLKHPGWVKGESAVPLYRPGKSPLAETLRRRDMQPLYAVGWDDAEIYYAITVCASLPFRLLQPLDRCQRRARANGRDAPPGREAVGQRRLCQEVSPSITVRTKAHSAIRDGGSHRFRVGVFVSFVATGIHVRDFPEAGDRGIRWSREAASLASGLPR